MRLGRSSTKSLRRRRGGAGIAGVSASLLLLAVTTASLAAAASPAAAFGAADDDDVVGVDVPATPSESALEPFGLYGPFRRVVGGGNVPPLPPPCSPRQIHLSLGDEPPAGSHGRAADAAAVTVSFSVPSDDDSCRPEALRVSVVYGTTKDKDEDEDEAGAKKEKRRRYATRKDVRWYNATSDRTGDYYESDWIYHVHLKGLDHDKEYWYRIEVETKEKVENVENEGWVGSVASWASDWTTAAAAAAAAASLRRRADSADVDKGRGKNSAGAPLAASSTLSFRTAPPPGSRAPTKVALLGDLGQTYNSTRTMLNILRETRLDPSKEGRIPASLAICAGDMSYADTDQGRWDNWFDLIEPLISRTPLQVTAGNHEIECDAETRDVFAAYERRFRMPNPAGPARTEPVPEEDVDPLRGCGAPSVFRGSYDGGNAYYAFTHGMVRFLALSPYSDASLGSRQYRWLERELGAVDRSVTPWVVAVLHVQFYTTFRAHNDELPTTLMRQAVEPLLVRYGVNLVVSGHDHAYMRTKPMRYGKSDPEGKSPVYVIVGEGGNREQHVKEFLRPEPEEWVERRDRTEYGFGTLEVANATWARWRWVRDGSSPEAGGAEDGMTDDFWLPNQHFL